MPIGGKSTYRQVFPFAIISGRFGLIPQGWLHKLGVNEFDRRPRMSRFAFSRAGMFHVKHPVPYPTKTLHNQHKRPNTYNTWVEGRCL